MALSPSERSMRSRLAAHTSWARTVDPSERTRPARESSLRRFEDEVDPDRRLPAEERARRAEHARRAYFTGLALKSARARRLRAEADAIDREVAAGSGDAA
jgi:hypothetical protein